MIFDIPKRELVIMSDVFWYEFYKGKKVKIIPMVYNGKGIMKDLNTNKEYSSIWVHTNNLQIINDYQSAGRLFNFCYEGYQIEDTYFKVLAYGSNKKTEELTWFELDASVCGRKEEFSYDISDWLDAFGSKKLSSNQLLTMGKEYSSFFTKNKEKEEAVLKELNIFIK